MLNFFEPRLLIDPASADWLFDAYDWALANFDRAEFFSRSRLVQPSNEFFPGSVDNVHAKAETIFQHTLQYAGLKHWPFQLQAPEQFQPAPVQYLELHHNRRNSLANHSPVLTGQPVLALTYHPQQTLKPEDLSASFAHLLAQHLVSQTRIVPPGGPEFFAESTELLAIFMGFGVLFANSAHTFHGGCGGCGNAAANRQAALGEDEAVFALALYCRLKEIPTSDATQYLKKHLKPGFKRALKQIEGQPEQWQRLLSYRDGI